VVIRELEELMRVNPRIIALTLTLLCIVIWLPRSLGRSLIAMRP